MSNDTVRDVRQRAEDAAHTAVGVSVLGFQQAQARGKAASAHLATVGREAKGRAASLTRDARAAAGSLGTEVKQRVEPVVADVRARVRPVLASLRDTARRTVGAPATSSTAAPKPKAKSGTA